MGSFEKIAAFDYDHTLVKPRKGATYAQNVDDWMWLDPKVPEVLRAYHADGYCIMIFTNQAKQFKWKVDQIAAVVRELNVPILVNVGIEESDRKPSTKMFDALIPVDFVWDRQASFYCGDALGREGDWSDTDLKFAEACGLTPREPEEVFGIIKTDLKALLLSREVAGQEVVVMTGYPGSGKSTLAIEVYGSDPNYVIVHGDEHGSDRKKMVKAARDPLTKGKSIVFDATNPSVAHRAQFVELAKSHGVAAVSVHVDTNMQESMRRNEKREKPVPKIAYYTYRKNLEEPTLSEGFDNLFSGGAPSGPQQKLNQNNLFSCDPSGRKQKLNQKL
jgi:bifunctional polynucleotide phosphatase/kinase